MESNFTTNPGPEVVSTESIPGGGGVSTLDNLTSTMSTYNHTGTIPKIFLQTAAAQGIAGAFTFAAIIITCFQVSHPRYIIKRNYILIILSSIFIHLFVIYCTQA